MLPVETISAKMLDEYVGRRDAVIIDLRKKEEFLREHVRTARNIPYEELEKGAVLPENKLLILYCDRGGASLKAARKLAEEGYRTRSVIGGFLAYRGRNLVISHKA